MLNKLLPSTLLAVFCACGGGGGGGAGAEALAGMEAANLSDDPELALQWATVASPPQVYTLSTLMLTAADLGIGFGATCPTVSEDGATKVYEGGCTHEGQTWVGRATVTEDSSSNSIVFEGFGMQGPEDCGDTQVDSDLAFTGEVTLTGTSGGSFDVDLMWDGTMIDDETCETMSGIFGIDYRGQVSGADGETRWSGSGRVGISTEGFVQVETEDELLDSDVCEDEALSGTTRITSGGHTIAITYDGQIDCDPESTVRWSFDGQDRGELTGVSCAAASGRSGLASAALLIGLAALIRRRARPRRPRGQPECGSSPAAARDIDDVARLG